jgi:transmembrane sensor
VKSEGVEPIPRTIKAEAAAWLARLHAETRDAADEAGFRAWLTESPRHARAWEEVTAAWHLVGGLGGQARVRPGQDFRPSRRALVLSGLLATLLVGVAAALRLTRESHIYSTETGEQRRISLSDGSSIMLDTNTLLRVALSPERRRIELVRGRAHFDVAPDPMRPFIVQARDRLVVAIGTAFDIACSDAKVAVVLVSGHVVVRPSSASSAPADEAMSPGDRIVYRADQIVRDRPDLAMVTAWQSGRAIFQDEPLAEAVAEMNQYDTRPIVLADRSLDGLRISGVYRTGDTESFARSLTALLPASVEVTSDQIVLSRSEARP